MESGDLFLRMKTEISNITFRKYLITPGETYQHHCIFSQWMKSKDPTRHITWDQMSVSKLRWNSFIVKLYTDIVFENKVWNQIKSFCSAGMIRENERQLSLLHFYTPCLLTNNVFRWTFFIRTRRNKMIQLRKLVSFTLNVNKKMLIICT